MKNFSFTHLKKLELPIFEPIFVLAIRWRIIVEDIEKINIGTNYTSYGTYILLPI